MTPQPDTVPDDVLDRVSCASLVDAMGRLHSHRAHILSLVSPAARRLFGPVATIAYLPYRDDLPETELGFGRLFHQAMDASSAGTVLVLSSGGYQDVSHAGGTKLSRLQHNGAAGVLVDGRLRDFEQLSEYAFASWYRGEATRWGGDTVMPFAANIPVEVDGVCVIPGDYLYADASGRSRHPPGKPRTRDRRSAERRGRGREGARGNCHRATYGDIARVSLLERPGSRVLHDHGYRPG
jgi:regulator of RNase E activity RraA